MKKLVIFDCDGVIVNSEDAVCRYYNWLLESAGAQPIDWKKNDELRRLAFSMSDKQILSLITNDNQPVIDKMIYTSKTERMPFTFDDITLTEGLKELLEHLQSCGILMAVCTNRGRSLNELLQHYRIDEYFTLSITSADVVNPKPSPEGVQMILEALDIKNHEAIFLGDSEADYHAATGAGVEFISFCSTLFNSQIINNMSELKRFI